MPIEIKITIPDDVVAQNAADDYMEKAFAALRRGLNDSYAQAARASHGMSMSGPPVHCGTAPEYGYGKIVGQTGGNVLSKLEDEQQLDIEDSISRDTALYDVGGNLVMNDEAVAALREAQAKMAAAEAAPTKKTRAPRKAAAPAAAPAPAHVIADNPQDEADEVIDQVLHGDMVNATMAGQATATADLIKTLGLAAGTPILASIIGAYPITGDFDEAGLTARIAAIREATVEGLNVKVATPVKANGALDSLFDTTPGKTYKATATGDEVKAAMNRYIAAFGEPAAKADLPAIMSGALGTQISRFGQIPDSGASYGVVFAKVDTAIDENPYKRPRVASLAA